MYIALAYISFIFFPYSMMYTFLELSSYVIQEPYLHMFSKSLRYLKAQSLHICWKSKTTLKFFSCENNSYKFVGKNN